VAGWPHPLQGRGEGEGHNLDRSRMQIQTPHLHPLRGEAIWIARFY
jgi:hypothetical protein